MSFNIFEKLKDSSYDDGKFLSDKSCAYDTVYFISKFIKEYSIDGVFDVLKWKATLGDYIAEKWQLLDKNAGLFNYYSETVNLLEYSHIVKKEEKILKIIDLNLMDFITKDDKMENSYIYLYLLCYFTIKNSGCFQSYIEFCKSAIEDEKKKYFMEIHDCLNKLNKSVKKEGQWSNQNTTYVINILNFINKQPWVSREFTFNYDRMNPSMISTNNNGTRTKYPKKNDYLNKFDYEYVNEFLKDYIIEKGDK